MQAPTTIASPLLQRHLTFISTLLQHNDDNDDDEVHDDDDDHGDDDARTIRLLWRFVFVWFVSVKLGNQSLLATVALRISAVSPLIFLLFQAI